MEDAIPAEFPGSIACMRVDPDGRIVSHAAIAPENVLASLLALPDGWQLIEGRLDSETIYFAEGRQSVQRPLYITVPACCIAADGVDSVALALDGDEVEIMFLSPETMNERAVVRRRPVDVSDGKFEFATTLPGTYEFEIVPPWPYQTQRLIVVAL